MSVSESSKNAAQVAISFLDWLVGLAERLVVLTIAGIVFYSVWHGLYGNPNTNQALKDSLKALSDSWKGMLLLLIPLFYRTVRTFLEKVRKIGPMETEPQEKREADQSQGV